MRKRIVVVSDAVQVSTAVAEALTGESFHCESMADLVQVRSAIVRSRPALLILDILAWQRSTRDFIWDLNEYRGSHEIRKLVLCAQGNVEDKVEALELGADQFLLKPVSPRELRANVQALLRTTSLPLDEAEMICVGPLSLSRDEMKVMLAGEPVAMSVSEFNLLEYLAIRTGRIVDRSELLQNLWWHREMEDDSRSVEACIHRVRTKIEEDPAAPRRLLHFRGKGYMLVDAEDDDLSEVIH